jgi:hypothetical protein
VLSILQSSLSSRLPGALRLRALKAPLVIAVATIAAGTMAGIAVASSPRPPAAPPPVDHQLCYTASASGFTIPTPVTLKNQFSPNGFVPTIGGLAFHCNPVQKTVPSGQVFPITNPNAHLACFRIAVTSTQPTPTVRVTNQFGSAILVPSQPNLLCLPSWKSLTGPPNMTVNQPPGLNHFTCYPVKVQSGAYTPPPVMLQDEFASTPVPAQVNPVPAELCLPTEKIVNGVDNPIINAATHLLCFPVSQTPIVPQVWDQNQFGTSVVQIGRTTWLCVPSTKQIVTG